MNLISVIVIINVCAGLGYGTPASLEASEEDDFSFVTYVCPATNITTFPPDPSSRCCGEHNALLDKLLTHALKTDLYAHPWSVIIEYTHKETRHTSMSCGGALISGKYVLTAAHCIAGQILDSATPQVVRLGEYDITNEGMDCVKVSWFGTLDCTEGATRIAIERTIPHPEFDPAKSKRNDIGLVRLKEMAPYTDFIHPVCLPTSILKRPENTKFSMVVVGWGASSATEIRPESNVKQYVEVPFVSYEKCQPAYNKTDRNITLWRGQLCAGGVEGVQTCRGDSGGALVYDDKDIFKVIGIGSFGPDPCVEKDTPRVYTNVYEYLDWIKSVIVA